MRSPSLALAALALAGSALAQEPAALQPTASTHASSLSRAEVMADLEMWHRAGMTYLTDRETGAPSAEYRQGLERYSQLRASPAFLEAVARLQGHHTVTRN